MKHYFKYLSILLVVLCLGLVLVKYKSDNSYLSYCIKLIDNPNTRVVIKSSYDNKEISVIENYWSYFAIFEEHCLKPVVFSIDSKNGEVLYEIKYENNKESVIIKMYANGIIKINEKLYKPIEELSDSYLRKIDILLRYYLARCIED